MSLRAKTIIGLCATAIIAAAAFLLIFREPPPTLPNSPVSLRELIDKSEVIVYARITKMEFPAPPLTSVTNYWTEKLQKIFGKPERPGAIAHLQVMQTAKGRPAEKAVVNFPLLMTNPTWRGQTNFDDVIAFLSGPASNYRPVASTYGVKMVSRSEADIWLRWISEYVAAEKLSGAEKDRERARWLVRLIEDPVNRWDGAASWTYNTTQPGEAAHLIPSDELKRIETVAFRDEPLAAGDELLLKELAPTRPKEVTRRLTNYLRAAMDAQNESAFPQPWRCYGAVELLGQVAGMSPEFNERLRNAPYADFRSARARAEFINSYRPEIEVKLREKSLID